MIIRAADLDPEGMEVDAPLVLETLRTDADEPIEVAGLRLAGRLRPRRGGLSFRGRLTCTVIIPCARCLQPYGVGLDRAFDLEYDAAPPAGKELQIPDDDLDCGFLEEGGVLDLRQVAEEQIYLELPMKPLCSPACRGLCRHCGGNLNVGACRCRDLRTIS